MTPLGKGYELFADYSLLIVHSGIWNVIGGFGFWFCGIFGYTLSFLFFRPEIGGQATSLSLSPSVNLQG